MVSQYVVLASLTIAGATVAMGVIVAGYLLHDPGRRFPLAPAASSLALVGPAFGIGAASKLLMQTFADLATDAGAAAATLDGCNQAATLLRLGDYAAIVSFLAAAGLGWSDARPAAISDRPRASRTRLVVLALLFVTPILLVASLHEYARRTNRMAVAVVESPSAMPEEGREHPASIATIAARVSTGIIIGFFATPVLLVVLVVTTAASMLLANRVQVPLGFQGVGTVLLALGAALAIAGILTFNRPVQLP